jgi:hypothetical protein
VAFVEHIFYIYYNKTATVTAMRAKNTVTEKAEETSVCAGGTVAG